MHLYGQVFIKASVCKLSESSELFEVIWPIWVTQPVQKDPSSLIDAGIKENG